MFGDCLAFPARRELGNCASVSVANITVYYELRDLFINKPEIVFDKRFLDDIFTIVNIDDISDFENWVKSVFQHPYLEFTHTFSDKNVNFLDLSISLNE